MKCIHVENSGGGFQQQHTSVFCAQYDNGIKCEREVEAHAYTGHWCGNVCKSHAESMTHRRGSTEIGPVQLATAQTADVGGRK